jgi:uncharacterized lipoprotein YmbA
MDPRRSVLAVALCFALSACGSSPTERFFTLASPTVPLPQAADFLVVVGPITIPEIVDRPQIVVRTGSEQVEIAEQARWAAPLKSQIPRVVADELTRVLKGARTATSSERTSGTPDYRVVIDIPRFESSLQDGATVQASWTVQAADGSSSGGQSVVKEPAQGNYDSLVAAHRQALARLSRDIATAIEGLRARQTR